jgi:hypothetical protein
LFVFSLDTEHLFVLGWIHDEHPFGADLGTRLASEEGSLMVAVLAPDGDLPEAPRRPMLRLVDDSAWWEDLEGGPFEDGPFEGGPFKSGPLEDVDQDVDRVAVRRGRDVSARRRLRAQRLARRRVLLAGLAVAAALVLLALPLRALGGTAVAGPPSLRASVVYVVQPGDSLWSIASRVDPSGDPRALVSQLEAQTGSDRVVPGEHLRLP